MKLLFWCRSCQKNSVLFELILFFFFYSVHNHWREKNKLPPVSHELLLRLCEYAGDVWSFLSVDRLWHYLRNKSPIYLLRRKQQIVKQALNHDGAKCAEMQPDGSAAWAWWPCLTAVAMCHLEIYTLRLLWVHILSVSQQASLKNCT